MSSTELFHSFFQKEPSITASAHGRVNLIGEHTDYTGGYVMPTLLGFRNSIELSKNEKILRLNSKLIVGADGANSRVRKSLGVKSNDDKDKALAIRAYIDSPNFVSHFNERSLFFFPFGLPIFEITIIFAFFSSKYSKIGNILFILVSSVIFPFFIGTFKSSLNKTILPLRSLLSLI